MARRANEDWDLPTGNIVFEAACLAVLMDLRDEIKSLNNLLYCQNFVNIPRKLERIVRNTAKRRRKVVK